MTKLFYFKLSYTYSITKFNSIFKGFFLKKKLGKISEN